MRRHRGDTQRAAFVECPVGEAPARQGKASCPVGGSKSDVQGHAAARAVVPPYRTCRAAPRRRDHELARRICRLLGSKRPGPGQDLQAARFGRSADRYPFRYRGCARRDERARRQIMAKVFLGGAPLSETAFGPTKDLATAVQFASSIHAELPVAASALSLFEEAEAAGLGEADATTVIRPLDPASRPKMPRKSSICPEQPTQQ